MTMRILVGNMKLSIVTICFNNLSGFKITAESITRQSWKDFEWIVIDGGSTDGTREYINGMKVKPDYWVSEKDNGIYDAMNKGLTKANGQYTLFLNGGDCFYNDHILEDIFATPSDADVIYGDLAFVSNGIGEIYHYPDELNIYFLLQKSLGHPACFFKTKSIKEIGGYDTMLKICSDWKVFVQFYINGKTFEHKPICVAKFDINGISSNNDNLLINERDTVLKELMTTQIRETMSPKVSVIIPCYNQESYLKDAILSIVRQSYQNWEIIIVNDGSTDNSAEVAKELAATDPRILYISQDNQGVSAARNKGIKVSRGKYILPLDGDDTIEKDYIVRAVEYLEEHPKCVCFYCRANMFGRVNQPWDITYTDYDHLLINNAIFCSSVYRRTDFDRIGGYDETFRHGYEDWEFYIQLLANGGEVYQDEMRLFNYRQKRTQEHSMDSISHKHEEHILNNIYIKHFNIYTKYFSSFIAEQRRISRYEEHIYILTEEKRRLSHKINKYKKLCLYLSSILAFITIILMYALINIQ